MAIKTEQVVEGGVRTAVVTVGTDATIINAAELKEGVLAVLPEVDAVRVDVTSTTEADLSLLQLVCALHRSAVASGKTVTALGFESGNVAELAEAAGFSRHIGCFPENICLWSGGKE